MFESYMRYQYADPRGRRQMTLSALVAGALTLSTITLAWATSKMEITRVDAPAMDTILFQLGADAPLPPPPPPPPLGVVDGGEDPKTAVDKPEAPPEETIAPPNEAIPPVKSARPRAGSPTGVPEGIRGGRPTGIPIGIPTGKITDIFDPLPPTKPPPTKATPPLPITAVMARGIYTPNPEARLFVGKADRRPCTNRTHFCVDPDGRVGDVRTAKSCGDAEVDRICREAVKKWRFRPAKVAGDAHRACSVVDFSLVFKE